MSGIMSDTLVEQILAIRAGGKHNMFDIPAIQREASDLGYTELVVFLEENRDQYVRFIFSGNRG